MSRWINADNRDVTDETLAAFKKVIGGGTNLQKAATITLSNNLVAYDLEKPQFGGR